VSAESGHLHTVIALALRRKLSSNHPGKLAARFVTRGFPW
jgi:hypothetical protein